MKYRLLLSIALSFTLCDATVYANTTNTEGKTDSIPAPARFSFVDVHRRAAELAKESFNLPENPLPDAFKQMGYDEFRHIRFIPEKALWYGQNLPFIARFFHRGFIFNREVKINTIHEGTVTPFEYNHDLFTFKLEPFPESLRSEKVGFAGLQLFYPLSKAEQFDEFASFLGASYFRAIGQGHSYGLSTRGLAIDTAERQGEEFPYFREFWLTQPTSKDATELTVYALLDSKSVTGAYRFIFKPGLDTVVDVKATIFMRTAVQKLGIAPLTSMFYFGENSERKFDDFRPEIHDSDGLLIATGHGEWIWRPLTNYRYLKINSFVDENPEGFGLIQRDQDFNNYQDLGAMYHNRPSAWIQPLNKWGKGMVQLVEIPTNSETNDNIVVYWVPEKSPEQGEEITFEYRITYLKQDSRLHSGAKVIATRIGAGGTTGENTTRRKFVLDFSGEKLANLEPNAPVEAMVSTSSGTLHHIQTEKNPYLQGWRVHFELEPDAENKPIDLRCFLRSKDDWANVLSETWSYQWSLK